MSRCWFSTHGKFKILVKKKKKNCLETNYRQDFLFRWFTSVKFFFFIIEKIRHTIFSFFNKNLILDHFSGKFTKTVTRMFLFFVMPFLKKTFQQFNLFHLHLCFLHGCLERKEWGVLPLMWSTVCAGPLGPQWQFPLKCSPRCLSSVFWQHSRGFSPASLLSFIPLKLPSSFKSEDGWVEWRMLYMWSKMGPLGGVKYSLFLSR